MDHPAFTMEKHQIYNEYPDDGYDDNDYDDDGLFEYDDDDPPNSNHDNQDDDYDEDDQDDQDDEDDKDDEDHKDQEFLFRCAALYKGGVACKAIFENEQDVYAHLNSEHGTTKWLVHEFVKIQN